MDAVYRTAFANAFQGVLVCRACLENVNKTAQFAAGHGSNIAGGGIQRTIDDGLGMKVIVVGRAGAGPPVGS
jgi:hypothetical protein